MTVEFHTRPEVGFGTPTSTSGAIRPLMLMNRPYHTVHYTGLRPDQIWFSGGDGVFSTIEDVYRFSRRLEEVARGSGKPFEYNTLIPVMSNGSAHVVAYADEYVAAHSAGENTLAHGTLIIAGVGQDINQGVIEAFTWWNAVLEASGRLQRSSLITPHGDMPDGNTSCPGLKIRARLPELRAPYVAPAPPTTNYKRIAMADNFEFASATRWDTRGFGNPLPAGQYNVKLDGSAGKIGATVNMTIVGATAPGFGSAWAGGPQPNTSKINYGVGGAIANEVSVPLAADGSFQVYISSPAHIIFDLVGYWT
jgi:hypothetical protein